MNFENAELAVTKLVDQDALDLVALGHDPALSRKFSLWSLLALAFCVLGSWGAISSDLATGFSCGGPVIILWGLVLVALCNLCVVLSLGELCSSMPTALGQAYYVLCVLGSMCLAGGLRPQRWLLSIPNSSLG